MPCYGQFYKTPTPVSTVRPTSTPRPTASPIYTTPTPFVPPPQVTPTPVVTPSYTATEWEITIRVKENGVYVQKDVYTFTGEQCYIQWNVPCIIYLKRN